MVFPMYGNSIEYSSPGTQLRDLWGIWGLSPGGKMAAQGSDGMYQDLTGI